MFLRKSVFHLILFCTLILLLGYLTFFLFTSKAWATCVDPGGACTANADCCDDCGRNYCDGNSLKNNCQPGVCSSGICTLGIGRPRTHTEQCDCWCTQPIGDVDAYCGGDARRGTQCDSYGCCENVDGTGREGTCIKKYTCSGTCEYASFTADGCGNGQCACGETAANCAADCATPAPTPTPSGSPTPTPSGSPTPTPTPNGSPTPTPTPTPLPGCSSSVTMSASPNPVIRGSNIIFTVGGDMQASLCVDDRWSGGVTGCSGPWNTKTCTANTSGSFTWTHYWWYNFSCPVLANRCNKSIPYIVTTPISPWIQVSGDVHTNSRINAPGGP